MAKRLTTSLLLAALILTSLFPYGIRAQGVVGNPATPAAQNKPLPPFPEDANRPPVDWSGVDWQEEIAMPRDREALYRAIDELERQGRSSDARALAMPKRAMWDDAVMAYYQVPEEIREIVRWHRVTHQKLVREDLKQSLQEYTRLRIRAKQAEQGRRVESGAAQTQPEQKPTPVIDLRNAPQLDVRHAEQKQAPHADSVWIDVPQEVKHQPPPSLKLRRTGAPAATLKKPNTVSRMDTREFSLSRMLLSFFATPVHAYYAPTIPLMEYYDGIENHPIEYFLYYLSQTQNEDGSWGAFNEYELTGNIALLLSNFNKTDTDQYALAIQYLINAIPENDREAAFKARLMYGLGEPYQTLLDDVLARQNPDFGFGMVEGFASDAETSLEVVYALKTTGYGDEAYVVSTLLYVLNRIEPNGAMRYSEGANPSYHLINKTSVFLAPFEAQVVAYDGGSIAVRGKIDAMLAYLASQLDVETGELVASSQSIDILETLESFQLYGVYQDAQEALFASGKASQNADGSFGTSLYAGIAAMRGLAQPDIAIIGMQSIGGLVNGTPAVFELSVKNIGYQTISDMHLYDFVDGYQLNAGYNIGSWGVTLAPGQETVLTINFNDTASFIGDTEIAFYLEGANEYAYDNNWLAQAYVFAANAEGDPTLPMYYIAQKHDISGNPAVNIRWQVKEDANRKNYVIVFREKGAQNWSYYGIDTTWNGAFLSGPFTEDGVYEVTAGVLHLDGTTITYFSDTTEVRMSGDEAKYQGSASGTITVGNEPGAGIVPFAYGGGFGSAADAHGAFSFFNLPNGTSAAWIDEEGYAYFDELVARFSVASNATTTNIRLHTRYKEDVAPPSITAFWMPFNSNYIIKNQQENLLQVSGFDNLALKEADFYYWNPDDAAWLYLGTQAANGGTAEFSWYVPEELEGSGYKIRAALSDWQGNQSAFAEWGPFEIKDSTPPTGTIAVAGLVNNEWPAGEQRTITWDISAQNTLQYITAIKLHYGNVQYIASSVPVSETALTYTIPAASGFVADQAYVTVEACDANQNCATFESDPFAITDTSPPVSAPWGVPAMVENFGSVYGLARSLIASFIASPGVHEYLYIEYDGLAHEAGGQHQRLVYRTLTLDSWSEPVVLKEYWYHAGETNEVLWSNAKAVRDAAGGIHIVYEHEENIGSWQESRDTSEIRYLHFDGASVVSDIQLSSSATDTVFPVVAVASDGTAHVAWREGYSYVASSGTPVVRHRAGNGMADWSAIETISPMRADAFALTASGAGVPAFVFESAGAFYASRRDGGAWSSPAALVGLDAENANNLHLFMGTNNAYQLFYRYGSSATGWQYRAGWAEFTWGADGSSAQVARQEDIVNTSGEDSLQNLVVLPALAGAYHILYINSIPGGNYRAGHAFFAHGVSNFGRYVSSEIMSVDSSVLAGASKSFAVRVYFSGYLSGRLQLLYNSADYAAYAGAAAKQESINVEAIVE